MSEARAAACIVGGLLLAIVGIVGTVALVVTALADVYTGSIVVWLGLPLLFIVGATLAVYGIVVGIREVSGGLGGLADVSKSGDIKRLYEKLD